MSNLVLLLHGLAGSGAEMRPLAAAIEGAGFRVIAPDQRGHGRAERRPTDVSRQAYVDDARAVVGDEPAWLIGQSMGAHTAMLLAAARPAHLTNGLVLIEGGVGGAADDYPARLERWFASWPVPFADEAAAREFLGDRPITDTWVADLERTADGLRPRFDADIMGAAIRGVAETARWPEWERLTAPTLLILGEHGTQDPIEVRRMESREGVRTVVVPGAGHDVHLEEPQATAELIVAFLSGGCRALPPRGCAPRPPDPSAPRRPG